MGDDERYAGMRELRWVIAVGTIAGLTACILIAIFNT